jgi:hypothetical protein
MDFLCYVNEQKNYGMDAVQVLFVKIPFFQKVGNGLRVETFQVAVSMWKC